MKLETHWVSNTLIEVRNVDEMYSGVLDAKEAKELARELIRVAEELLSVDEEE